jgi:penicillin-binding protein 2
VGVDKLISWADKFGLGKISGIDLPAESAGLLPTPEWKKAVKGERWFLGNTYHMAIGQGDLTISVLQANMITAAIANGGKLCQPHLKMEADSSCRDLGISKDNLAYVKEGMIGACSSGGTAPAFFDYQPQVGCKTGTAETYEEDEPHAWLSLFAPADNPEIVLTVFVEHGGEGSAVAAPIAREIMDYWNLIQNP